MIPGITSIHVYFGPVGIASVLGWFTGLLMLALYARSPRRTRWYWIALAAAALGLSLGRLNSRIVSTTIQEDRSDALDQAKDRTEWMETPQETQPGQDSAETNDAPTAPAAMPGPGASSTNAEPDATTNGPAYTYRAEGKVERETGKKVKDRTLEKAARLETARDTTRFRLMPAAEVRRANHLDRLNLFCATFAFWLALAFVATDYLSRFNTTFNAGFPLPLACRLLDRLYPKSHSVLWHSAEPKALRQYLEDVVRKGETFVYVGDEDPWANTAVNRNTLPRIRLTNPLPWILCLVRRIRLRRRPHRPLFKHLIVPEFMLRDIALMPLRKLSCTPNQDRFDNNWVFESAWFGRYAFVVVSPSPADKWLGDLIDFLTLRRTALAAARRTVNVVWNSREPMPPTILDQLLFLCPETNYRMIVISAPGRLGQTTETFEETRKTM